MNHAAIRLVRDALFRPNVPGRVSSRFRTLGSEPLAALERHLREHYFARESEDFFGSPEGRNDLHDHLTGRLDVHREWFIPWIDAVRPLDGMRILEIGCGTGSSTVALAEQGADVTGLDLSEPSLEVARRRLELYDLKARVMVGNATEFERLFAGERFDLILLFASLEHMLHEERLTVMRDTWNGLEPGALWCVTDTPNRLWFFDIHTAHLPFFDWLPHDLALDFIARSPRPEIARLGEERNGDSMVRFLRSGRGVSFHEFELAMRRPVGDLRVASAMRPHFRRQKPLRWIKRQLGMGGRYERFLARAAPEVPLAFLLPKLDLVLERD